MNLPWKTKQVSMTRECFDYRPTAPRVRDTEHEQPHDDKNTIQVKKKSSFFLSEMIAKLDRTLSSWMRSLVKIKSSRKFPNLQYTQHNRNTVTSFHFDCQTKKLHNATKP